ncbi:PxORF100 peptide [Plutella xylostella granulovirus]|jgi:hypothetical protein|uniref:ORF98 protein n=1 Tax=Plutella xylostella granulovirus TaxID=98383 RepID=Q9DVT3_9BBAC|nr:PxORF100 peptide [Plutella xylostella granulovirus]AAG27398.1 PxORF100 peptide [Plutella xylostella granulovirus]AMQ35710.1 PxGV-Corf98 protein [Plutella xylostella granulovirus]AMQ35827.1 PxGV-Korf98 protein [Plutella xylostella granulovirus]AMQ35944.1 PxGV-Morf98 protein [Plutella xylostella granulovirus]AMQ36061.1 PxGV-Torf98 protein [Plutella xylostella granulovirus]
MDDCVEIFGYTDCDDVYAFIKKVTKVLDLDYKDVVKATYKGNGILVKLISAQKVNQWERKSRDSRITLADLGYDRNDKIKIFAAAPTKYKLLLHTVRNALPNFKYIWISKRGVMARRGSRTQIHLIKDDKDIKYLSFY